MSNLKKTGKMIGVAVLAASTALSGTLPSFAQGQTGTIRLAQAEEGEGGAEQRIRRPERSEGEERPARARPEQAEEPAEAPTGQRRETRQEEPSERPQAREAPEEEAPTRRQRREAPAAEEAPRERPAAAEPAEGEQPSRRERRQQAEEAETPQRRERAPAGEAEQAEPTRRERATEEAAPAEETQSPAERAVRGENAERLAPGNDAREETPRPENPRAEPERAEEPGENRPARRDRQDAGSEPRQTAPAVTPETEQAREPGGDAPARNDAAGERPAETPPTRAGETPPAEAPPVRAEEPRPPEPGQPAQENAATGERPATERPKEAPEPVSVDVQNEAVPEGRIGESDARVQRLETPVEVRSITADQGERIELPRELEPAREGERRDRRNRGDGDRPPVRRAVEPELPRGVEVVDRVGDRDILSIVGAGIAGAAVGAAAGYFIRPNDEQRLVYDSQDRYAERLSGGRVRETVVRRGGVQVVTITNRYGDVIQRSRIAPDGRETVLFYDPYERDLDEPNYYYDAGRDLPPIRVTIPEDEYIVDIDRPDEQVYYRTMVAPPVETVERIYSVDEVRRSQRIRDKVRRIDLATINFDFGSDRISQDQVGNLEALAKAVARIIEENPAETFLIEGHTDAVGSDRSNLALSDRRATSVASALTEYFDVPPENLVTQGYGEQYLKVDTQGESRENRRVTVRRITPLVKPVETSQAR